MRKLRVQSFKPRVLCLAASGVSARIWIQGGLTAELEYIQLFMLPLRSCPQAFTTRGTEHMRKALNKTTSQHRQLLLKIYMGN